MTPVELYFVYAPGCHACEKMKPVIAEFTRKYGEEVYVEHVDITNEFPPLGIQKWTPDKTPTMIFRIGQRVWVTEGAMSMEELENWAGDKVRQAGI